MPTTIEITDEGWRRLNARKGPGDGFKDVVDDLLNEAETTDQPDLAVALDALQEAAEYAEDRGMDDVAQQLGELYQTVGREAPADDWDDVNDDHLMAVDHVVYKSLGGDEQAAEFREYSDRDDSLDVAGDVQEESDDDGPRRLDNPAWKDRMRTDAVDEETETNDVVEELLDDWQPGRTMEERGERKNVARAALELLIDDGGELTRANFVDQLLPEYDVESQSEDTWWRKSARPGLTRAVEAGLAERNHGPPHTYEWTRGDR